MAATSWSTPYEPASERRLTRSDDPAIALQLQLDAIVSSCDLDALVVADLEGASVEMSGDPELGMLLAEAGAALFKDHGERTTMVTTRGFMVIEPIALPLKTFVVVAHARFSAPEAMGVERAIRGVRRILTAKTALASEAPVPLLRASR
jgi:hypothetical protein